ncbi:hypothetical protein [Acinetobacter indicus]|uniref:hypothetical protein n=1 Tax=Acinetobacter indicus TaxID=756892 RepID=UPI00396A828D
MYRAGNILFQPEHNLAVQVNIIAVGWANGRWNMGWTGGRGIRYRNRNADWAYNGVGERLWADLW